MLSTNGYGSKRAVLYARVSTAEQARLGYSLAQQLEALREYAAREGYEVLEEVSDPGQSGASLERPGMDRVRDLVAEGGVSVVLAQDRDRFAREPAYHYLLRREFAESGCALKAMNDRGDDTPEGELTDGILDQLAKFERAKTAERTRRGKLRKAREGKLIAGHAPRYGFRFNESRSGYVVDDAAMAVVRRIFEEVAAGTPMWAVKITLETEEVPAPSGGKRWSQTTLRKIIQSDSYKPHAVKELLELVPVTVVASLDPDKRYGVSWYGRRRTKNKQVAETGADGTRRYRRPGDHGKAARGVDRGAGARLGHTALLNRRRQRRHQEQRKAVVGWRAVLATVGRRCGLRRVRQTLRHLHRKRDGKENVYYNYYACPTSQQKKASRVCQNGKGRRAEPLEERVWSFVSSLLKDPETLRRGLSQLIEKERGTLRGDPEKEAKAWLEKLSVVERKRRRFQEIAAEGLMSLSELKERLAELDEERRAAEEALEALKLKRGRLEALERDADALLASYAGMVPEALDALSPEERQRVYKMMHLKVHTYADGSTALGGVFASGGSFYAENGSSLRAASRGRSARPRSSISETASTTSWSPRTAAPQETRPGG